MKGGWDLIERISSSNAFTIFAAVRAQALNRFNVLRQAAEASGSSGRVFRVSHVDPVLVVF